MCVGKSTELHNSISLLVNVWLKQYKVCACHLLPKHFCLILAVLFTTQKIEWYLLSAKSACILKTISADFYFATFWLGQIFLLYFSFGGFLTKVVLLYNVKSLTDFDMIVRSIHMAFSSGGSEVWSTASELHLFR